MAYVKYTYLICYNRFSKALDNLEKQKDDIDQIAKEISFLHEVWDSVVQKEIADKFDAARAELLEANRILSDSFNSMKTYLSQCKDLDSLHGKRIQSIADEIG